MASYLADISKWFSKGDNLKNIGSALVAGGNLYNGYNQNKLSKRMIQLNEKDYNRGIQRENTMDKNFSDAFNTSNLSKKKKIANQPLVALG